MAQKIGFTQGAFDMFHIGHLNLLKNARKHCDYLIVGVNSDELIKEYKGKPAIISFKERIAIIDAVRYVNETIKTDSLDKLISWNLKHYNLLFIGDDWKGNQRWIETGEIMERYSVKVIYLPYTQLTSSSVIREKLLAY